MHDERIWVVIPTYWGPSNLGLFDHPTPIDGESTLPALLDSLSVQIFPSDFCVLILVSAVSEEYADLATKRVKAIAQQYQKRLQILVVDVVTARILDDFLVSHQLDLGFREMRNYASVRNMQLLVPAIFRAEVVVALDDDEVVSPDYLSRATKWIGRAVKGRTVYGLVGPYLNNEGSPYLHEPDKVNNLLIDKAVLMNRTMRGLIDITDGFPVTSMGFGGNMIIHREMFSRVGFDPAITRGEDIDYIINARIAGMSFYFDSKLTVIHKPPRQNETPMYAKLRQDVIRFIYQQKKLEFFGFSPKLFDPYPGILLRDEFPKIAEEALEASVEPELIAQFGSPGEIIAEAQRHSVINFPQYEKFTKKWTKSINMLKGYSFSDILAKKIQVI